MNVRKHLKLPELMPLFFCTGVGFILSSTYLFRLATKGPEVTWSRVKNPEPWQTIPPNHRIKLFGKDYSGFSRPAPDESYAAIKES